MQKLEVKIVTEKEWGNLVSSGKACAHVDEESMGFAKPGEGKAYVRQTYWPELNKYLMRHEIEHLLEEEGTDECVHGVRHKKFFKEVLSPIYRVALPVLGGLVGGPLGAAAGGFIGEGQYQAAQARHDPSRSSLQAGLTGGLKGGAIAGGTAALGNVLTGGVGKVFSRPQLGTIGQAGQPLQTTAPGVGGTQLSRLLPGGLPGGGPVSLGASGYNPGAAAGITRGSFGFGGGSMAPAQGGTALSRFGQAVSQQATSGQTPASGGIMDILSKFGIGKNIVGPALLGGGLAGFGQLAAKRPEVPELGQIPGVQQFGRDVQSRLGPLSERARTLSQTSAPDSILSPIRERFRQSRNQLTSQFKLFRPGADLATDTEYARAMAQIDQLEAESTTKANLGFQEQERSNIATQLGIDVQQLDYMQQLAGLDVETIRTRTGLSFEEASQFKQIFGQLGATVAGAGLLNAFGP